MPPTRAAAPSLGGLFHGFAQVGLSGFGGVLPWVRRMVVEQRRWLDAGEFTDLLALCQLLPGPNVGNLAVLLGARFHGWRGAAAAMLGLFAAPLVIIMVLGAIYERYAAVPQVQGAFAGLAAAASGLVLANAIKIALPMRNHAPSLVVAAASFLAIAWLRLPLFLVVGLLAPLGMLGAWQWRRR